MQRRRRWETAGWHAQPWPLKRGKGDFANYRPVSLMSTVREILKWIIKRMDCEPLTKESGGFRSQNGFIENKIIRLITSFAFRIWVWIRETNYAWTSERQPMSTLIKALWNKMEKCKLHSQEIWSRRTDCPECCIRVWLFLKVISSSRIQSSFLPVILGRI